MNCMNLVKIELAFLKVFQQVRSGGVFVKALLERESFLQEHQQDTTFSIQSREKGQLNPRSVTAAFGCFCYDTICGASFIDHTHVPLKTKMELPTIYGWKLLDIFLRTMGNL